MPSDRSPAERLTQQLVALRSRLAVLQVARIDARVTRVVERAIVDAARAVDGIIERPGDDARLRTADDAILVARTRIDELHVTTKESRRIVTRSLELRRRTARLRKAIRRRQDFHARGVLIVDDVPDNRDVYAQFLSTMGIPVASTATGRDCLRMVRHSRPAVVVLDMGLPEMDGWEVARRLKGNPATRSIPVVALTGHALEESRKRALAAGVDAYLVKPCPPDELLATIRSYLPRPQ